HSAASCLASSLALSCWTSCLTLARRAASSGPGWAGSKAPGRSDHPVIRQTNKKERGRTMGTDLRRTAGRHCLDLRPIARGSQALVLVRFRGAGYDTREGGRYEKQEDCAPPTMTA